MGYLNSYVLGTQVRLAAAFTDLAGAAADPTAITLTIRAPDGTTTTPTPVRDGTGAYHYDQTFGSTGLWTYRWVGTGTVQAVAERGLFVQPSQF